jgi:hypothetical protein
MIELERRRFTFDEFAAMGEGLGHCELFDGHIYVMRPRSDRHTLVCAAVYAAVLRGIDSLGRSNDFWSSPSPRYGSTLRTASSPTLR